MKYGKTLISRGGSTTRTFEWQGTPLPRRLGGLAFFDPAHLPMLLKASVGGVISLNKRTESRICTVPSPKGDAENRPQ
jgi:hypothetical protein